ncbi:hypothetical protein H2198_003553 [Neophaeococcomyces mojaviensis]|uniref:Uncharacterized protein n=1 Tax=Neophaeococcomyces mojaviensis TaxID=3383035 RepID=A0ACC3AB14_9EURO|nr:hypothetical protein H2198_003553 [Knufia sp. JES_112]
MSEMSLQKEDPSSPKNVKLDVKKESKSEDELRSEAQENKDKNKPCQKLMRIKSDKGIDKIRSATSASVRPFSASIPTTAQGFLDKGAIEIPPNGIKPDGKRCLTCIRYVRRCKGSSVVDGRCETCRGIDGRPRNCFWLQPNKGIHTYDDAQKTKGTKKLDYNASKAREVRNLPPVQAYEPGRYRATTAWIAEGLFRNDLLTEDSKTNVDIMLGLVEQRHWLAQTGDMPSQQIRMQAVEVLADMFQRLMGMVVRGEGLTQEEVLELASEYSGQYSLEG